MDNKILLKFIVIKLLQQLQQELLHNEIEVITH